MIGCSVTDATLQKIFVSSQQKLFVAKPSVEESPQVAKKSVDPLTARTRARLDALRRQHKMNWTQVANAAGLVQQEVSRFSTGQMRFPALSFMDAIARVFHRRLADLLADETTEPSLTSREIGVLAHWRKLDAGQKDAYEQVIRGADSLRGPIEQSNARRPRRARRARPSRE